MQVRSCGVGVRPWEGAGERPSCESGSRDNYFTPQLGYVLVNVTGVAVHKLRPYSIGFIRVKLLYYQKIYEI